MALQEPMKNSDRQMRYAGPVPDRVIVYDAPRREPEIVARDSVAGLDNHISRHGVAGYDLAFT